MGLIKKLRKAKKEAPPNEKPAVVKTHLRDMIIVPEMIGSVVGIYNGKVCPRPFSSNRGLSLSICAFVGLQLRRNQARNGWPLPWRIFCFLQACQAWSPWCTFFQFFVFLLLTFVNQIGATHCEFPIESIVIGAIHHSSHLALYSISLVRSLVISFI